MNIRVHSHFKRSYRKRIAFQKHLSIQVKNRIDQFHLNPKSPLLSDHALTGNLKGFRAFSIGGDMRIVYFIEDDVVWLYDIGSHNQVY